MNFLNNQKYIFWNKEKNKVFLEYTILNDQIWKRSILIYSILALIILFLTFFLSDRIESYFLWFSFSLLFSFPILITIDWMKRRKNRNHTFYKKNISNLFNLSNYELLEKDTNKEKVIYYEDKDTKDLNKYIFKI